MRLFSYWHTVVISNALLSYDMEIWKWTVWLLPKSKTHGLFELLRAIWTATIEGRINPYLAVDGGQSTPKS